MLKQILLAGLLAGFISTGVEAACSKTTIQGQYAASGSITAVENSNVFDIFIQSRVVFDGNGGVRFLNGTVGTFGERTTFTGSGGYNVNSACLGVANATVKEPSGNITRFRLDLIVSGPPSDPQITALYTDRDGFPQSGSLTMTKIRQ